MNKRPLLTKEGWALIQRGALIRGGAYKIFFVKRGGGGAYLRGALTEGGAYRGGRLSRGALIRGITVNIKCIIL